MSVGRGKKDDSWEKEKREATGALLEAFHVSKFPFDKLCVFLMLNEYNITFVEFY